MKNMSMMRNLILMIKVIAGSIGLNIGRKQVFNYCNKIVQSFDCVYDAGIEFLNTVEKIRCLSGENACLV